MMKKLLLNTLFLTAVHSTEQDLCESVGPKITGFLGSNEICELAQISPSYKSIAHPLRQEVMKLQQIINHKENVKILWYWRIQVQNQDRAQFSKNSKKELQEARDFVHYSIVSPIMDVLRRREESISKVNQSMLSIALLTFHQGQILSIYPDEITRIFCRFYNYYSDLTDMNHHTDLEDDQTVQKINDAPNQILEMYGNFKLLVKKYHPDLESDGESNLFVRDKYTEIQTHFEDTISHLQLLQDSIKLYRLILLRLSSIPLST
jgi:hypothetical protein